MAKFSIFMHFPPVTIRTEKLIVLVELPTQDTTEYLVLGEDLSIFMPIPVYVIDL
jgi:hypothetical protein